MAAISTSTTSSFRKVYNIFELVTNLPMFTDTQVETDNHRIFPFSRLGTVATLHKTRQECRVAQAIQQRQ